MNYQNYFSLTKIVFYLSTFCTKVKVIHRNKAEKGFCICRLKWDEVEYKWDEVVDNGETSKKCIHVAINPLFHCYLPLHRYHTHLIIIFLLDSVEIKTLVRFITFKTQKRFARSIEPTQMWVTYAYAYWTTQTYA